MVLFPRKGAAQIRVLKLNDSENNNGILFRIQKGWTIRFMLGPTLASKEVSIYTNIPNDGEEYNRLNYRSLVWEGASIAHTDNLDLFAAVTVHSAGSFHYYFSYDGISSGSGYLIVDPTLTVGLGKNIPLDSICMQTVLSKLLGLMTCWKERLLVSKQSGYNAIHFTPIQKLGISNSSYSIADQLALNPDFSDHLKMHTFDDVKRLVEDIQLNWQMLCVTDVVWNHTANNSPWLQNNPECAYNLQNSPYLRPAYILDRAIFHLALDISIGRYDALFESHTICNSSDVEKLKHILEDVVIPSLKLHEFFQVDIKREVAKFKKALVSMQKSNVKSPETIKIIQDEAYTRLGCYVDIDLAIQQFACVDGLDLDDKKIQAFTDTITWLNQSRKETVDKDMKSAVSNVLATVTYERLSDHGPKHTLINASCPLVTCYFNHPFPSSTVPEEEKQIMNNQAKSKMIMAHNGWVMGANALENFADSPGSAYLLRELICWGDSVKLRYGDEPSDCPALWERMKLYTVEMAKIFHGIRIDNCHSTPIHVAEYMLDMARRIRPDLYVFAELFTGSEHVDNVFVNRLGLTSLIREAINAWDSHELGRLVYMYGGEPIASFMQPCSQMLKPSRAHALFYDVTHDNESMVSKRTVHDVLPSSALVSMSSCATGSNRGHDEMTPHHIHVVNENRVYRKWSSNTLNSDLDSVGCQSGMIKAKQDINVLHQSLAIDGFTQVFVDQRTSDVVAVTRHNPLNHHSYVMIAHTSFQHSSINPVPPMTIEGCLVEVAFEAKPLHSQKSTDIFIKSFVQDGSYINGIEDYAVQQGTNLSTDKSKCCKIEKSVDGKKQTVTFTDFPPGSVVVLHSKMTEAAENATETVRKLIQSLSDDDHTEFDLIVKDLSLSELNRILYHCHEEEQSDGLGIGVYEFPNFGKLSYCGIAGIAIHLAKIRSSNDLGHPICANLREGDWLLDYVSSRLLKHKYTRSVGEWYSKYFQHLKCMPRFLIPAYFEMIITLTYGKLLNVCWSRMSNFVKEGSRFVKHLSLGTVAMCGLIKDAGLPLLHPDLNSSLYSTDDSSTRSCSSMAAGLPHFSAGVMRCWGRDTFIAMHGLQLLTGQYKDASNHILAYAGCVRHGLIPNLLAEGQKSRYNCRDAVWFWLQCIQDLCILHSYEILQLPVSRIYPNDNSDPHNVGEVTQPLHLVMQEVLQRHVDGIHFRERNAGPETDQNMSDAGFNVDAGVNLETGFVYGGSPHNCGTWMDKMGESEKAGTKGVPATPRDGSAIELIGLCKSTVDWLQNAYGSGKYPHDGVLIKKGIKFTWLEWSKKISLNFEKHFHVSENDESHLVHKRYIYKDTFGATHPWCDYQLRPNFPIAMVYAPELFEPQKAWKALTIVQDKLLGPLGMKTLDPDDMQYRGDYNNSDDSDDPSIAKGFNYHQGPEWLWPVGYFLRAKLYFSQKLGSETLNSTVKFVESFIVRHHLHLEESSWSGLPELTNSNGTFCKDSCPIQAWSHGTLMDLLYDLAQAKLSLKNN